MTQRNTQDDTAEVLFLFAHLALLTLLVGGCLVTTFTWVFMVEGSTLDVAVGKSAVMSAFMLVPAGCLVQWGVHTLARTLSPKSYK